MNDRIDPPEKMQRAWDRMSVDYTLHTELSPADPHYQALAAQCPVSAMPMRVLDLGSGLGFALDAILPKLPNAQITCMDVSGEMLKGLMARLSTERGRINTWHQSYVDADLGRSKFDLIISSFTMHHLMEAAKRSVYQKICSALADNGRYIELDGVASPEQELSMKLEFEQQLSHQDGSDRGEWNFDLLLTIQNQERLLRQAGFASVEVPWTDVDETGRGRAVFVARS